MTKKDKFARIQQENLNLYVAKNKDYGDSFGETFEEFGVTMLAIRLHDKFKRFKKLIMTNEQEIKTESVIDTLKDLSNYAIMAIIELENEPDPEDKKSEKRW